MCPPGEPVSEPVAGAWTGVYFYPDDHPENADGFWQPTPFVADLVDRNGVISGRITEPGVLWGGGERGAAVAGSRSGDSLAFTKSPDDGADQIEYAGTISHDGGRIEGQWHIIGDWSGHFRMDRRAPKKPAEGVTASRAMPAGVGEDGP